MNRYQIIPKFLEKCSVTLSRIPPIYFLTGDVLESPAASLPREFEEPLLGIANGRSELAGTGGACGLVSPVELPPARADKFPEERFFTKLFNEFEEPLLGTL
mmetsp:Transcript_26378/g.39965  ORF Transcript_26378/g.39965 Transcript_26378/m.39965 type:complete len:102 (+) Transcript_26378:154-459(+)